MVRDTVTPFLTRMGQALTYTPAGGAGVALLGIPEEIPTVFADNPEGENRTDRLVLRVSSAAANGVVQPAQGDAVTFRGRDWSVRDWTDEDGAWALLLVRSEPTRRTSEKHFTKKLA